MDSTAVAFSRRLCNIASSLLPSPSPPQPSSLSVNLHPHHPSLSSIPTRSSSIVTATTDNPWRIPSRPLSPALAWTLEDRAEGNDAMDAGVLATTCPQLAFANVMWFKAGNYNVKVVVEENEPEEVLVKRFRREVMKAGVVQECKRRRFFEDKQAKRKRKTREAAKKNRNLKRRPWPKTPPSNAKKVSARKKKEVEEEDNWELPEGDPPYC